MKGKDGIEVNKYRYRKERILMTGEISWRCTNRNCSASLKTNQALTSVKSKPFAHNHDPPDMDTPSTPSVSKTLTPTLLTTSIQTPTLQSLSFQTPSYSTTDSNTIRNTPLKTQAPSLSEIMSPYITLTPVTSKFPQLDKENQYLRQPVAELTYTNEALTDKLIELENHLMDLNHTTTGPDEYTFGLQTDENLSKINSTETEGRIIVHNRSQDYSP